MICPHCGKSLTLYANQGPSPSNGERWFDAFWSAYPRHVGKAAALKAWKKAATSEAIKDDIMVALKCQLPDMLRHDKSFIPHAATWLNGRRWEDEYQHGAGGYGQIQIPRVIACELCGDSGTITELWEHEDTVEILPCSCARGALPGLMVGVYRVSTGERLGDVPATPTSGDGAAHASPSTRLVR